MHICRVTPDEDTYGFGLTHEEIEMFFLHEKEKDVDTEEKFDAYERWKIEREEHMSEEKNKNK